MCFPLSPAKPGASFPRCMAQGVGCPSLNSCLQLYQQSFISLSSVALASFCVFLQGYSFIGPQPELATHLDHALHQKPRLLPSVLEFGRPRFADFVKICLARLHWPQLAEVLAPQAKSERKPAKGDDTPAFNTRSIKSHTCRVERCDQMPGASLFCPRRE